MAFFHSGTRGGRKKSPHHFIDVDKMVGIVVLHPALLVVAVILSIGNDDVVNEENPHRFARLFQSERQTVVIMAGALSNTSHSDAASCSMRLASSNAACIVKAFLGPTPCTTSYSSARRLAMS